MIITALSTNNRMAQSCAKNRTLDTADYGPYKVDGTRLSAVKYHH
jgi:hypothetical protein